MKRLLSDIEGLSAEIENLGNLGREELDHQLGHFHAFLRSADLAECLPRECERSGCSLSW